MALRVPRFPNPDVYLSRTQQQREQSVVGVAEVLHDLPGLGPAPPAVDCVQVRVLGADGALS